MSETQLHGGAGRGAGTHDGSGAGERTRAAAHDASEQAKGLADSGKHEAGKIAGEVKSQTSELAHEAGHKARDRADSQVSQLAHKLDEMSGELDQMASSTSSDGYLAMLARDGATAMRSASRRLDDGGLDGAMRDVRRFARRRPGAFLAGAFAVGLVAGRATRNADMQTLKDDIRHSDDDRRTIDGPDALRGGGSTGSSGTSGTSGSATGAATSGGTTGTAGRPGWETSQGVRS